MNKTIPLLLLLCIGQCFAQNISGYWQGDIAITKKDTLAVGFFIQQVGDSLHIEADSPDQYAIGLATSGVTWADSTLSLKMPEVSASFSGRLSADGQRIVGTFRQGGSKFALTLTQGVERTIINRPQTPQPPYPYTEEEIRIKEKGGKFSLINGTLTMPAGAPKALVILITGSGWQDRNESLFGHKPFLVIADHLTRQGYAVFRYDDFPQAVFAKSTTYDFADGVTLILDSLARRSDLSAVPMGLLGHSEGCLVAEIVAARDPRVAFIVSLGGVAQPTTDVLLYQLRAINTASGQLTPEEIDNSVVLSSAIYKAIEKAKSPQQAGERVAKVWDKQAAKLTPQQQERYNYTPANRRLILAQASSSWFYTFFQLDPKKYLAQITCPVLAIGGEKDLQVEAVTNNALFEKLLPANAHHQFVTVPNANHLLQSCTTGAPDEYSEIEETIKPEVLEMIQKWLDGIYR